MKLEVGMYVRTKSGYIYKLGYYNKEEKRWICIEENDWYPVYENSVVKASHNIIDLIEAGDYVNGHKVYEIDHNVKSYVILEDVGCYVDTSKMIDEEDIKSIVTKEQFESMSYKIEVEE